MVLVAVRHMFNLQTSFHAEQPRNICKAPQSPTNPSCPATFATTGDSAGHWCVQITACHPGRFIVLNSCISAVLETQRGSRPPGKQAVLVPVSISLHQSVAILGNSPCSHSGFIGTALGTWVGLSQLEFLCVAAIYLITKGVRWKTFIYFRYFQFPYSRPLCRQVSYHLKFRLGCSFSTLPTFLHLGVHSS